MGWVQRGRPPGMRVLEKAFLHPDDHPIVRVEQRTDQQKERRRELRAGIVSRSTARLSILAETSRPSASDRSVSLIWPLMHLFFQVESSCKSLYACGYPLCSFANLRKRQHEARSMQGVRSRMRTHIICNGICEIRGSARLQSGALGFCNRCVADISSRTSHVHALRLPPALIRILLRAHILSFMAANPAKDGRGYYFRDAVVDVIRTRRCDQSDRASDLHVEVARGN